MPGEGRAHPDVLPARLHGLTPDDADRAAARTAAHDAVRAGLIRQVVGAGSTGGR